MRISYPLQYSWASLVAQLVKNLPATWEIWLRSLGWEDSLEKGKATHSSILAYRIPWTVYSMGSQSRTQLSDFHFQGKEIIKNTDPLTASTYHFCHIKLHSLRKKKYTK